MSQQSVALSLDPPKHRQSIGQYENGGDVPNLRTVEQLSAVLNVSPCWLAFGDKAHKELTSMTWTNERPTEPGEYWVSIEPSRRVGVLPTKGYPHAAAMFLHGGIPCVGINGIALELKARCFDGAKWSRRETPADPFEEVTT